jgi:hypothetical protein
VSANAAAKSSTHSPSTYALPLLHSMACDVTEL